ncbi:Ferrous iron transport periplasmic protein EfeO, contains peptidase-M75 domain and (frequently) cupredoxin-like domain [[Actinomadura] parvosata subsp. kistnae]|uniref:Peptidase M75 n=2 Tax=Nonomuraea TaxID=83681 RepID=A0A1V0A811_9ACTN|nr:MULTISPECIES: iron uptake system protein EfeO [unclassified Nonomuraea]AQZ66345.1 peptidase M75 [Nonomuraea sp. ATCC 55076]NJP89470.1 peptidase M75 family protein [Nonomuraea sp. FMUSA5-5]SPL95633.1 Ferrous iron transport periplasmic protein EfeO, contains peptidase-M75 domain and (frequently) cupredoxin-like domain [Actinomadura parvosata subsp. kistnae]
MRNVIRLSLALPALAALAACGSGTPAAPSGSAAAPGKVTVAATDTECKVAASEVAAGTTTFTITNGGSKVTEFYVYAPGDRIMAEVENIVPGLTRELIAELPAGSYETACKPGMVGKGIRNALKVTGEHKPLNADAKLAEATKSYQRYVKSQTDTLLVKTQEFVDAVKAGDLDKGKELYPVARTYWERIEPVAEIFGDLDPAIDAREADLTEGEEWTGFHRIEKDLWIRKDVSKDGPVADKLIADVKAIVTKANATELTPLNLANGAKELLDEVATGKITGEEDIWSHTDLWDFDANLEGSQAAVQALRPVLEERAPDLVKTLDEKFAAAEAALAVHQKGDGWRLHDELSKSELKALSDAINALAEPISKIAPIVAK